MFTSLRKFTPLLEAHCTEADRSLLERTVLLSCIELCQQSYVHSENLPPIDAESGRRTYTLVVPPYIDIITVKRAVFNGVPLIEKSESSLDRIAPGWRNYPAGSPVWWHMPTKREVTVIPAPQASAAGAFVLRAVYKPSMEATHVWDGLYQDWNAEIMAGALAKLLRMPGKPWTDLVTAREHEHDFQSGITRAKVRALKENTSESMTAYPVTMGV